MARLKPDVVGFSLIFQYMAPEFGCVIRALRAAGCRAHITIGGHYPSFDYGEVLQRITGADSVVRFEGEATLVELMERLGSGRDCGTVRGRGHTLRDPLDAPGEAEAKEWTPRRKAKVVEAVTTGRITLEEALRRHKLTEEEFLAWQRYYQAHGLPGLRATRYQQYRLPPPRPNRRRR